MLEEKMQEEKKTDSKENGEKKDKDKDKDKKQKKHKHHKHKSHKSEKKHERKRSRSSRRSRSPVNTSQRRRTPTPPSATLPSGKRRDVNSELHQLAQTLIQRPSNRDQSTSKSAKREKSPELTPEERDLRTVFCKCACEGSDRCEVLLFRRYAISSDDSSA